MFYETRRNTPQQPAPSHQAELMADAAAEAGIITRAQADDFKRAYAARLQRDAAARSIEAARRGRPERLFKSPLVPIAALIALAFVVQALLGAAIL